jgi:uncharacterized protein with HEPN domain
MTDKTRRAADWVSDIRDAIRNIQGDIGVLTKLEFSHDGKSQRAVIKSLTDIGEAANSIMELVPSLQQSMPEIWQHLKEVYATRIRLTHHYHRTNPNIVFETVKNSLPELEQFIQGIAEAEKDAFDALMNRAGGDPPRAGD